MKKKRPIRIAIISSSFRSEVAEQLEKRCIETLRARGEGVPDRFRVPGAMELPLMAKRLAAKKRYDAIIVFGAVVKGATYHFEQVADLCARGCMQVAYDYGIPVVYEVLAVYKLKDAMTRATRKKENKGEEAALTALTMVQALRNV